MELEFVSKQFVKPSYPTPPHLRHLEFSFLDQLQPRMYVHLLHFYSTKPDIKIPETSALLKKSLSKALTIFYPVAGRINNNSFLDCNDEGILFVEAKTNCKLCDILREKSPDNNNNFIPLGLEVVNDLPAFSQITFFSCGGFVISFSMSHKLGDGLSMITFLHCWSTICGDQNIDIQTIPPFNSSTLFPPIYFLGRDPTTEIINKNNEKVITKIFGFNGSTLETLRAKYMACISRRLSRVEALVSFIWNRFIATTWTFEENKNKRYRVMQAVNLRGRIQPPLPILSFGNYATANVVDMNLEDINGHHENVRKLANSTRDVDVNYINMLRNRDEQSKYYKRVIEEFRKDEVVSLCLSSVQNFPVYETDFGWGKPLWFATTPLARMNLVLLSPTKDGLGVEAWICLKEDDMAKFEIDNQLIQYLNMKSDPHSRL